MPRDSMQPASHQTEASVSERQLEQWLNASLQLQSAGDFKAFAFCYIEQLINHSELILNLLWQWAIFKYNMTSVVC